MWWLAAIVAVYLASWTRQPTIEWFAGEGMVVAILALHAGYSQCKTFRGRSIFAFVCLAAWVDLFEYLFDLPLWAQAATMAIYAPWFLWMWGREYNRPRVEYNPENVGLLFLRPTGIWLTLVSFFGLPYASVCVVADGDVWCFRRASKKFGRSRYSKAWLATHAVVDTGVKTTPEILEELSNQLGKSRGYGCRCVYQIRGALSIVGMQPKTIFHYIPGIFAMRAMK